MLIRLFIHALAAVVITLAASPDIYARKNPARIATKLSEIVEWHDLKGGQYVVGMGEAKDENGKVITDENGEVKLIPYAIYDKTFAKPLFAHFWQNLILGTIGVGDISLARLTKDAKGMRRRSKKKAVGRYVSQALSLKGRTDENLFDPDWWRSEELLWKPGKRPDPEGEPPELIPLSDLEFEQEGQTSRRLKRVYGLFSQALNENRRWRKKDDDDSDSLTERTSFERQPSGYYRLVKRSLAHIAPTKVIDLRGKYSSFRRAILWATVTGAVKGLVGLVPIPGLSGIFSSIISRFFNLVEVIHLTRHAMALNLIVEAKEGNPNSPFYQVLREEELDDAIVYLKRTSTMISAMIGNLFSRKSKIAEKHMNSIRRKRDKLLAYLKKKGFTVYPFKQSFYALGIKRNQAREITTFKIFSLIKRKMFRRRPHAVVDFLNPKKEQAKRNIKEAILIGSNFISTPIPFLATIIRLLYKEIVIREVQKQQMYEAGFKGHLAHNRLDLVRVLLNEGFSSSEAQHYVDLALKTIEGRELNPLDLNHSEEEAYKQKVENWLKRHDPGYRPWKPKAVYWRGAMPNSL